MSSKLDTKRLPNNAHIAVTISLEVDAFIFFYLNDNSTYIQVLSGLFAARSPYPIALLNRTRLF